MSLQRKIYEQLAGLMEVDLRTTRGDAQRLRDRAERDRRQREREQARHQRQTQREETDLNEDEIVAYKGSKMLGSVPFEKSEMKDSVEAAKNLWPDADKLDIKSKKKTIKSIKVK